MFLLLRLLLRLLIIFLFIYKIKPKSIKMSSLAENLAASLSGLSLELRVADSGETIDLAGHSAASASAAIKSALCAPFDSIRRVTLVVSGGKLVRGKYDQAMFKECASALKEVGYKSEMEGGDEAAGGSWKSQHDTGKNLKTIVIYTLPAKTSSLTSSAPAFEAGGVMDPSAVDNKAACSSVALFGKMVESKVRIFPSPRSVSYTASDCRVSAGPDVV